MTTEPHATEPRTDVAEQTAVEGVPTDPGAETLTGIMARIDAERPESADGQFAVASGALIRCLTCHDEFPAAACSAEQLTRLEGASDPDDSLVLVPITCPRCGTAGSLVLPYGSTSDPDSDDVLAAMDRGRPVVGAPGSPPTPGVATD